MSPSNIFNNIKVYFEAYVSKNIYLKNDERPNIVSMSKNYRRMEYLVVHLIQ